MKQIFKTKCSIAKGEGFGLFPVRSSLLRESLLISCLRLLRYFSSPTSLSVLNDFGYRVSHKWDGFLHSEISGSSRDCSLPEAYRKLQRPSSDMSVKESVIHLYVTFFVPAINDRTQTCSSFDAQIAESTFAFWL